MGDGGSPIPSSLLFYDQDLIVRPSVLHPKSFTKTRHEHHIYVLVHVMEWIDEVLQPKMINKNVKWEAITQLMYIK